MNRDEYLAALALCLKLETVGAIAGEVAMLLRANSAEKAKLDAFRRIEACNKIVCTRAFQREGAIRPEVEADYYRNGIKLGLKLGTGDWKEFLDHFEATIHPELFSAFVLDDQGNEIVHSTKALMCTCLGTWSPMNCRWRRIRRTGAKGIYPTNR